MKLVIHARALLNESLSQSITGYFDERGGTIGRSDTNTLTLPDPERHVSRLQAEVSFAGGAFAIRNVGSANPIELNGRTLQPGEGAPLAAGDRLLIGGYAMQVDVAGPDAGGINPNATGASSRRVIRASAAEPRTDPHPKAGAAAATPRAAPSPAPAGGASDDPFSGLLPGSAAVPGDDPFADLAAPPAASPKAASGGRPVAAAPAPAAFGSALDDLDPFADLGGPLSTAPAADLAAFMSPPSPDMARPRQAQPSDNGLGDVVGARALGVGAVAAPSSLDDLFGLGAAAGAKPGADPLADFLAPQREEGDVPAGDLLDLYGTPGTGASQAAAPSGPSAFNHTPELSAAYAPPPVKAASRPVAHRPQAPAAAPARAAQAPANDTSPEALWRAFCEGAGVSLPLPQTLSPELMRTLGQLMQQAIGGALKLLAARAAAKQELRAQVTTIQSKNNNPLKFSVDTPQALAQLLQPPMRGFMPGPEAVRDAMDDLLGHHIGTMAGTNAALQGVLQRFEPDRLAARLTGKSVIDAMLPMNRRAKLWEMYVTHYQRVHEEAQEDFHALFGKAFVKAYEEQMDRLEAARREASQTVD